MVQQQIHSGRRPRSARLGWAATLARARACALRAACLGLLVALSIACPSVQTPAPSSPGTSDFTVQYSNYDAAAPSDNLIEAGVKIRNDTSASVPLSSIVVRYWFTKNGATRVIPACLWWDPECGNITLATGTVAATGADRYVEIRFGSGAGSLAPGATTQAIDLGIELGGTNVDETDDYSYKDQTSFADWSHITVHDAGSSPMGGLRGGAPPTPSDTASRPAAPASLTATAAGSGAIALSWSASAGAEGYNVYRSSTSGFTPSADDRLASGVGSTGFSDTGLTAGTTYHYRVTAVNASGESPASNQASATTQADTAVAEELFDDFSYASADDASFRSSWYRRSEIGNPGVDGAQWLPSNVSVVADPANSANKLLRLQATTRGTGETSSHAEVSSVDRKFRFGTYAARVSFNNTPLSGTRFLADKPVQTFFTITEWVEGDPDYSEQDFEYMPNGGWGQGDKSTLWMTSWQTTDHETNTSTLLSGDYSGWHTLLLHVTSGSISYYVDGAPAASHGAEYAPETEQFLDFNLWYDELAAGQTSSRTYHQEIDWVYFAKDHLLSTAEVEAKITELRSSSLARRDTLP